MRRAPLATACLALTLPLAAGPADAATIQTYRGQATSVDPDFRYGRVTVKRVGARVTFVEIKAVTANCSGQALLRTIVYRSSSREMQVVSGSNRISRTGTMRLTYRPDRGTQNAVTRLRIVFSGRRATGTFDETGLCTDRGRFTAAR